MQRLNCYSFFQLGTALKPLETIEEGKELQSVSYDIYLARIWLEWFLANNLVAITFSKDSANNLLTVLRNYVPGVVSELSQEKSAYVLTGIDTNSIRNALRAFQIVLQTELGKMDTYFVSQKGIYSTSDLIERADNVLPFEILQLLPEPIVTDLQQAGRCLAFDLSTAAGFHIMRAVEAVLRDYYYPAFVQKKAKGRTWAAYIRDLDDSDADPKVISILDQIRSLHRNPTIHPEEVLTINQAMTLFAIAQSAIVSMVEDASQKYLEAEALDQIPISSQDSVKS